MIDNKIIFLLAGTMAVSMALVCLLIALLVGVSAYHGAFWISLVSGVIYTTFFLLLVWRYPDSQDYGTTGRIDPPTAKIVPVDDHETTTKNRHTTTHADWRIQ